MQTPDTDYQGWKQNEALVPVAPGRAVSVLDPTQGGQPFWTSIQPSDPKSKSLLRKCLADADATANDFFGKPFLTQHLFIHNVELADPESGEVLMVTRSVLVSPAGDTLSMCSSGAIRSLRAIIATEGPPPWNPPLPIVIRPVKTRRGFTTYNLDILDTADLPPTKSKRS